MTFLNARTASPGIAAGPAVLFRTGGTAVKRTEVLDPAGELERFTEACEKAKEQLGVLTPTTIEIPPPR